MASLYANENFQFPVGATMIKNVTLQKQELIEQLQQVASEQETSAEELLDAAVQDFLDKWVNQKIQAEIQAFTQLHPQLVTRYLGQYVAIHNRAVVDHDPEARPLHLRMRQKYGRMPVLLRQVTKDVQMPELIFRSPKLSHVPQ